MAISPLDVPPALDSQISVGVDGRSSEPGSLGARGSFLALAGRLRNAPTDYAQRHDDYLFEILSNKRRRDEL